MLPLPNLDDKLFEQIVLEARKSIPKLLPEWTDENAHDPGITLIELFSWLTEMQQFYLNRIPARNELKYLKLLGLTPREAVPASTEVLFQGVTRYTMLPKGTKLLAADVPFETVESLTLLPAQIDKIIVRTRDEALDLTTSNAHDGVAYYAFGPDAGRGSRLYIGFDQELPIETTISIATQFFDRYPVPIRRPVLQGDSFTPSASISWKFYGSDLRADEQPQGWHAVEVIRDETSQMMHSGRLTFRLPVPMKPVTVHPANDRGRYWLCCTVEAEGFELAPKIDSISINTVLAVQQHTLSEVTELDSSGAPNMLLEVSSHLAYYGSMMVQTRQADGSWIDWEETSSFTACTSQDRCYRYMKDADTKLVALLFGDGQKGLIPPAGPGMVRLIAFDPGFAPHQYVGSSNGLSFQQLELDVPYLMKNGFHLQVGVPDEKHNSLKWLDWEQSDDLELSHSEGRHYVLGMDNGGVIRFGDNEQGQIPEKSSVPNIRILACRQGGGARGNVKRHVINRLVEADETVSGLTVTNRQFAVGGQDRETLEAAKQRLKREWKQPSRAVTAADYEQLALTAPGLRVAKVKAIPLYAPGMKDYPAQKVPAQMTLVAVPYSEAKKPLPSKGFLHTMRRYLEPFRILTTELHIVPPEYIKVTVHAVVIVEPHFKDEAARVIRKLNRYLHPIGNDGSRQNGGTAAVEGWTFGRPVYRGDLYGVINSIPGVSFVKDLWIIAEGRGVRKEANGDVLIPPHGLVYSGEHEIELVAR